MSAPPGQRQAKHQNTFIRTNPNWRNHAACQGMNPEQFFPRKSDAEKQTIKICLGCPVRFECLQYALDTRSDTGVWGGTTQEERKQLLRRRRTA